MTKVLRSAAAAALVLASAGCYHAIVDTGRPASGEMIEEKWAHGFLWGLVPPKIVETASKCPDGVAKVETQHSFLNQVAYVLTGGIYSPMQITVSCAGAGSGDDADAAASARRIDAGAPIETQREALARAARRSLETGQPQYVKFE